VRNEDGETGYKIFVGGGLGRTPRVGRVIRAFLPKDDLLIYVDQILHVYNQMGRRDNKYKARIKILVDEMGLEEVKAAVEARYEAVVETAKRPAADLVERITEAFAPPKLASSDDRDAIAIALEQEANLSKGFAAWLKQNTHQHFDDGHHIVSISLKAHGATPGDASADQMRVLADLAERYAYDELRVSHEQNIILPHVPKKHLFSIYQDLVKAGLATANIGLVSDIIACPGMDYCALATARSIPVAQEIASHFEAMKIEHDIGPLKIKISGCINACGHHHVGHIGILGLDRAGVENYQITLGGDGSEGASLGDRTGPGFAGDKILNAIEIIITTYLNGRKNTDEHFLDYYRRVGMAPFKAALYDQNAKVA